MTESSERLLARLAVERGGADPGEVARTLDDYLARREAGERVHLGQMLVQRRCLSPNRLIVLAREAGIDFGGFDPTRGDWEEPSTFAGPAPTPTPSPPRRIGGYEILEEIGRGGMGVVYRARHQALGREVALKVLLVEGEPRPSQVRRFAREGLSIARLDHPNIVRIYEWGRDGDIHFIAMPLVPGDALDDLIEKGTLSRTKAARLVESVARALHYAHEAGVVHRDLKPGNIRVDEEGNPVLLDFGLAQLVGEETDSLTRTGQALGTPYYMSPEQCRGEKESVDRRTDVYAAGVILYELLTGRRPFSGRDAVEIYRRIQEDDPIAPRSIDPRVPRALEAVCLKAMARRREDRYPAAADLADDLARHLKGDAVRARPAGALRRLRGRLRRARVAILCGTAALAGIAGTAAILVPRGDSEVDAEKEEANQEEGVEAGLAARGLFLYSLSTRPPGCRVWARRLDSGWEGEEFDLGSTPVEPVPLPAGFYAIRVEDPAGRVAVQTFPVEVGRGGKRVVQDLDLAQVPEGMALVPAGPCVVGPPSAEDEIDLPAFAIDRTEVTIQDYARFVRSLESPYRRLQFLPFYDADRPEPAEDSTEWLGGEPPAGKLDFPVSNISYGAARHYAFWASKRLPAAGEWEKAARGIDRRPFPWGWDDQPSLVNALWPDASPPVTSSFLMPAGALPGGASPYGLLHVLGNVREWTSTGTDVGRLAVRGGGFPDQGPLHPWDPGVADAGWTMLHLGFRCARSLVRDDTEDELLVALESPIPGVRQEGARLAAEREPSGRLGDALLLRALADHDVDVRFVAARALPRHGGPEAFDRVLAAARSGIRERRMYAIHAALLVAPVERLPEVFPFLSDGDRMAYMSYLDLLLDRRERGVAPVYRALVRDPTLTAGARILAATLLADLGDDEGTQFLHARLAEDDKVSYDLAVSALIGLADLALVLPWLENELAGKDLGDRKTWQGVRAFLGPYLRDRSGLPVLREGLSRSDANVRAVAVHYLGLYRDHEALESIRRLAQDPASPDDLRQIAEWALERFR
ncbi:MAG: protein kinase [Planctomycetes bacterium]|nr:protein kinase [Planctomycetota bacterium]